MNSNRNSSAFCWIPFTAADANYLSLKSGQAFDSMIPMDLFVRGQFEPRVLISMN